MLSKEEQPEKEFCLISLAECGMETLFKPEQSQKRQSFIALMPCGMTTDSKLVQFMKAYFPKDERLLGKVISLSDVHPLKASSSIVLIVLTKFTSVRDWQLEKIKRGNTLTSSGIVIDLREVQFSKVNGSNSSSVSEI